MILLSRNVEGRVERALGAKVHEVRPLCRCVLLNWTGNDELTVEGLDDGFARERTHFDAPWAVVVAKRWERPARARAEGRVELVVGCVAQHDGFVVARVDREPLASAAGVEGTVGSGVAPVNVIARGVGGRGGRRVVEGEAVGRVKARVERAVGAHAQREGVLKSVIVEDAGPNGEDAIADREESPQRTLALVESDGRLAALADGGGDARRGRFVAGGTGDFSAKMALLKPPEARVVGRVGGLYRRRC